MTTETEIKVRLPGAVVDFLRKATDDIEQYLSYSVIESVRADLDNGQIFSASADASKLEAAIQKTP